LLPSITKVRVGDLLDANAFAEKLKEVMEYHNFSLTHYYGVEALDYDEVLVEALEHVATLKLTRIVKRHMVRHNQRTRW
jgi:adenylosuccinate synthase